MFVDRIQIELHAGKGGDGCTSFRREKYVPKGGPDGGDGGNGASIILEAKLGVNSLSAFANRKFYRAEKGQPGLGSACHGRDGRDLVLYVPPGTTVIDSEHGFVIRDLVHPGDRFVVARGGRGGRGNVFYKSSTNRAPREHGSGELGEIRQVILELKSIADVGLIGKPNAGKSTLLSRISSARPEIADYPFTTKYPNLGLVELSIQRSFIVADIPGLIEGASEGIGLGHEFLRHIERAGLLVHLVEPAPMDQSDPLENYKTIRAELVAYDPNVAEQEELLVVTKCEMPDAVNVAEALRVATGIEPHLISAVTGEGVQKLLETIMDRVLQRRRALLELGIVVPSLRPSDEEQAQAPRPRRVPPHRAEATRYLSNEYQAKDADAPAQTIVPTEPRR